MKQIFTLIIALSFLAPIDYVSADAWWGKGYKPPAWVLANGGTIINVNVIGNKPNHIKGFLRQNGKYVEVEFGKSQQFDDAKNGIYTITFYNCNRDCRPQETDDKTRLRGNDSQKGTITISAKSGQTVTIVYNNDTGAITRTSAAGSLAPPPPTPAELAITAGQRYQGQFYNLENLSTPLTLPESRSQKLSFN